MKINNLKINAFGNIKDREIKLSDNINIIQGKNESGKSTILKFISNSLYGISKNKKGREFSDYERYKPWEGEEFSGKISYELDDKTKYEVFRDFNKKNPKIYNENSEDISKEFGIDKTKGSQFFYEQTKIDEDTFLSTLVSMQQEVRLDKNSQNVLVQKIANLVGTGDDNVSYKKALEKINRRQIEEIGTSRSQGRPINIIQEEKQIIQKKIEELQKYKSRQYEIEEEKNKIEKEIENKDSKLELFKEIKIKGNKIKIDEEELKLNEKINVKNKEEIEELVSKREVLNKKYKSENVDVENNRIEAKGSNKLAIFLTLIIILINIVNLIFIKELLVAISLLIIPLIFIMKFIQKNKNKKENSIREKNKLNESQMLIKNEIDKINSQVEILQKNYELQKQEIIKMSDNLEQELKIQRENIKRKYNINIEEIAFNNIEEKIEALQNEINKIKLDYQYLELERNNILPKLEKLASYEEQYESMSEKENILQINNQSMELVKQVLEVAYEKMKKNVTPKFTQNLSKNIKKISNGKYDKIKVHDEFGIIIEKENGEYIPVDKLSVGTIEQLYLSLRFAMIKEISKENMPIILDEAFAYYDTERLKNVLIYLHEEFKDSQILIFTCTDREKEILDEINIEYKLEVL